MPVVLALPLTAQQRAGQSSSSKWEVLDDCKLASDASLDGDSFHVQHGDREYIFRLYFVDAPETDERLRQRIEDQAAYFGVSTNDVPAAGRIAAEFTRQKLGTNGFTVMTRWQNAMGRSSLARFYAMVFVHDENLAEQLVANGLARIHGYRANWPGGPRSSTFISQLKNQELGARENKLGLWNEQRFSRIDGKQNSIQLADNNESPAAKDQDTRLDLNTASDPALEKLPGIGRVLAGRIIAHRPFKSFDELDDVPGIGRKTMAKLRPLVRVVQPNQ